MAAMQKTASEQLKGAKALLARTREGRKLAMRATQHTLMATATAFGVGYAEGKGVALPTVAGRDPKLVYGVAAAGAALMLRRGTSAQLFAQSMGDGLLSVVAHESGKASGAKAKK